jgi:hypothetical protein
VQIENTSLACVQRGINGKLITIEDDVLDIARRLKAIHPSLHLYWNEQGEYFVIYELCEDGRERLVTTVKELDSRLIEHFEMLASESWDPVAEMDRMDDAAEAAKKDAFAERVGEIGERLHHALRSDYGFNKDRVYVPEAVSDLSKRSPTA